jgi:hypothetical protein
LYGLPQTKLQVYLTCLINNCYGRENIIANVNTYERTSAQQHRAANPKFPSRQYLLTTECQRKEQLLEIPVSTDLVGNQWQGKS